MIMRNKYDWDRQGHVNSDWLEAEINRLTTFFVSIGLRQERGDKNIIESNRNELLTSQGHESVAAQDGQPLP